MKASVLGSAKKPDSSRTRWAVLPLLFLVLSVAFATAAGALGETSSQIGQDIAGEAASDFFGGSVAISADGSRIVAGARLSDGNGTNSGQVRIFKLTGATWEQVGQDINGEAANDVFGESVAISADGSRIVAGASGNDGNGNLSGHVRVFELTGKSWTQVGQDIDGEAANDFFGRSVAMNADGSRIAAGAPGNNGNGSDSGQVRVFERTAGTWTQVGQDIDGDAANDFFGEEVVISADGSRIVAGALRNSENGSDSGQVRVFERTADTWTQVGQNINGDAALATLGSVAISADGSRIAAGAPGNSSGHVRVFELTGATWEQVGQDISGETAEDGFGGSVAMNADGSRIIAGAAGNNGNGSLSGHVRVFELTGKSWTQVGQDINGETINANFGRSVAMNADGSRITAGAPRNSENGADSGHVRIFQIPKLTICDGLVATVVGTPGDDVLAGTAGPDVIAGLQGDDTILALGGDDIVCGGQGNDTIFGGQGFDILYGAQGNDLIYSSDGSAAGTRSDVRGMRAFGGAGDDRIFGSNRWDRMQGGPGRDQLFGYEGRDWMRGGSEPDIVDGGTGIDDLHGGNGNDTITLTDADTVRGGAGAADTCEITGTPTLIRSCEIRR